MKPLTGRSALLEQLGVRFELVLEAVSGFGGRLDALREEIFGQFTEVGRQIRFLSEQIAENRDAIAGVRSDLGAKSCAWARRWAPRGSIFAATSWARCASRCKTRWACAQRRRAI